MISETSVIYLNQTATVIIEEKSLLNLLSFSVSTSWLTFPRLMNLIEMEKLIMNPNNH